MSDTIDHLAENPRHEVRVWMRSLRELANWDHQIGELVRAGYTDADGTAYAADPAEADRLEGDSRLFNDRADALEHFVADVPKEGDPGGE